MTQKEIEELRKDPMAQILSSISGIPIDELIKEFEAENSAKNNKSEDLETTYPLDVAELKQLVYSVQSLYLELEKLNNLGINIWNSIIGVKIEQLIVMLIDYLYDSEFSDLFIKNIKYGLDKDPDELVYNLIDYLNSREYE